MGGPLLALPHAAPGRSFKAQSPGAAKQPSPAVRLATCLLCLRLCDGSCASCRGCRQAQRPVWQAGQACGAVADQLAELPGVLVQGKVPQLLLDFAQAFTTAETFTPLDLAACNFTWPSVDAMAAAGKRVMIVSGVDYLAPMAPLIFSRRALFWCPAGCPAQPKEAWDVAWRM